MKLKVYEVKAHYELKYIKSYDESCNWLSYDYVNGYILEFKVVKELEYTNNKTITNITKSLDLETWLIKDMNERADKEHLGEELTITHNLIGYEDKKGHIMVYMEE